LAGIVGPTRSSGCSNN